MLPAALLALVGATLPGGGLPSGGIPIGDAARWLQSGDFPSTEWHVAAVTRYDLMIDELGQPVSCTITLPSGSAMIDKIACTSLMSRARYAPARDTRGQIVPQAIRGRLEWHPDSEGQNELRVSADLAIRTPTLSRKQGNVPVRIVVIYAGSGAIEQCVVTKPAPLARLNREACAEASKPGRFMPVTNGSGQVIRGLRDLEIVFSAGDKRQVTTL